MLSTVAIIGNLSFNVTDGGSISIDCECGHISECAVDCSVPRGILEIASGVCIDFPRCFSFYDPGMAKLHSLDLSQYDVCMPFCYGKRQIYT